MTFTHSVVSCTDLPGASPRPSFRYAGRDSRDFMKRWEKTIATEDCAGGQLVHETYLDPNTGLKVTVQARHFSGFAAVDWLVELENCGPVSTPLIEDILPLNVTVAAPPTERVRLHHARGSSSQIDDFLPLTSEISPEGQVTLAP